MTRVAMSKQDDARRLVEASAWRVALSEAGQSTNGDFETWLAEDSANAEAWDQVQHSWNLIGDHASGPELINLRRNTLDRVHRYGARRWAGGDSWIPRVAAVLLLFIASGLLYSMWPAEEPLLYVTAAGERRFITLEDGSKISLDSSTKVRVRLEAGARRLELLSGQARFDVAHDITRPFSVHARDRLVIATGTAFNIDLWGPKVVVTLIEGNVTVVADKNGNGKAGTTHSKAPARVTLTAGQQLVISPTTPARVETVSLDRATSWENGVLVFEDETLANVAERFNRYSNRPIRVDPASANRRISGVFHSGDVEAFVDTVSRYVRVRVVQQTDGSLLLQPAG